MSRMRMGMLLFVASESVFFVLLILAYVVYHRTTPSGADPSRYLDIGKTGSYSAALFFSSFTIWRAGVSFSEGSRRKGQAWLAATIALGATFLVGQGREYRSLIGKEVTISRDLFGTTFFTLTGFHGLHVFFGLVILATLLGIELKSGLGHRPQAVEAGSIYWHFVDVVWLVILPTVYLWVLR